MTRGADDVLLQKKIWKRTIHAKKRVHTGEKSYSHVHDWRNKEVHWTRTTQGMPPSSLQDNRGRGHPGPWRIH